MVEKRLCRFTGTKNRDRFGSSNGFILLQILPDGVEILTLAVHPDKRRRGLARRLMAHMMTALRPAKIWLEVAADNYSGAGALSGLWLY